ncbi:hypothetical protein BGT96224_2254B [Blumeria graminis f. sp. tritici 96224]|uniref:Bgt-2254-2 n=1 Tax=Blumeria graminis f. sp. tritici 96224 TaxID=1268274 RepID=A0A061HHS6_BLUGR|nr:hypothetical protein BGT96224_2254B [Blumeria graminis f. sp. tritici 96224]
MRFTYERAGATPKTLEIELNYNVQFVTAHPCISPPNTGILSSPTNPAFQSPTLGTPKIPNISSVQDIHYTRLTHTPKFLFRIYSEPTHQHDFLPFSPYPYRQIHPSHLSTQHHPQFLGFWSLTALSNSYARGPAWMVTDMVVTWK